MAKSFRLSKVSLIENEEGIKSRIALANKRVEHVTKSMEKLNIRGASVLIALFEHRGAPFVILTVRSSKVRLHKKQVALPGGKHDPSDVDFVETALRETEEEIGLNRKYLKVVGMLPPIFAMSARVLVYPVIAFLHTIEDLKLDLNHDEVDDVFAVPVEIFLRKENHQQKNIEVLFKNKPTVFLTNIYTWQRNSENLGDYDIEFMQVSNTHGQNKEFVIFGFTAIICVIASTIIFGKMPSSDFKEVKNGNWISAFKYLMTSGMQEMIETLGSKL